MPKKRQPKNAFSFFLDDAMVQLRKQGKDIKAKHEAVPHVHQRWKEMSADEKAPYEERAHDAKLNRNGIFRRGRLDCTGNRIDDRIDMDKVMVDERKQQKRYLLHHWQCMKAEEILEDKFYIVSFQSYFEFPDEEGYQPCELAVVEYSLKHGISREFHTMINPGPLKLGLAAEAKLYSVKYHKIPFCQFELGRTDHVALWNELLDFVNPERNVEFPPLFSKLSEHRKNAACLEYLAGLVGRSNRLSKVFIWEHLVLALYENAGVSPPSLHMIEDGGNSSMYDFERGTKCDYHDELECIYCSMLIVKKCCFWTSDAFTSIYKYDITENHLPVREMPQYSVINAEDIIFNPTTKKRFLGADAMPPYDPNLPIRFQRESLSDLLPSESSIDEDGVFKSRDIRYRKRTHKHSDMGAGRGMVLATWGGAISRSRDETQSIAETIDDVASAILEDDDDDLASSILADDEGSVDLRVQSNGRPAIVNSAVMRHMLSGQSGDNSMPSLSGKLEEIRLGNDGHENNHSPTRLQSEWTRKWVSDSSTSDDLTLHHSLPFKGVGQAFEQKYNINKPVRLAGGVKLTDVNETGKRFAQSKVGALALTGKPASSNAPVYLGRGRFLPRSPNNNMSTYQSDSD